MQREAEYAAVREELEDLAVNALKMYLNTHLTAAETMLQLDDLLLDNNIEPDTVGIWNDLAQIRDSELAYYVQQTEQEVSGTVSPKIQARTACFERTLDCIDA